VQYSIEPGVTSFDWKILMGYTTNAWEVDPILTSEHFWYTFKYKPPVMEAAIGFENMFPITMIGRLLKAFTRVYNLVILVLMYLYAHIILNTT
jgi:hypothetical protein